MSNPKILCFSGSTRKGSINTRLLETAISELRDLECEVTQISLADYPLPIYDGDFEEENGIPENATRLAKLMSDHDGFFITCPEYNGSLSPLMKNTIDWMTRVPSDDAVPFKDKIGGIGACSPGAMGGISMLYHLREILVRLGSLVVSEQVAVGNGFEVFDEDGKITDKRSSMFLSATCKSIVSKAKALKD